MQLFKNKNIITVLSVLLINLPLASQAAVEEYAFDANAYLSGTFDFDSSTGEFSNFDFDFTGLLLENPFSVFDNGTNTAPNWTIFTPGLTRSITFNNVAFAPDYSIGNFEYVYNDYVNTANDDSGDLTFALSSVAAVPEPETYAMFLAGLGLLGFARRRQQS